MPKETLKITDLSKGMNVDKSPRDLEDNEWSLLMGFTGTPEGILKPGGQMTYVGSYYAGGGRGLNEPVLGEGSMHNAHGGYTNHGFSITPGGTGFLLSGGYGLFSFTADSNVGTGALYSDIVKTDFLVLTNGCANGESYMWHSWGNNSNWFNSGGGHASSGGWIDTSTSPVRLYHSHKWFDGIEKCPNASIALSDNADIIQLDIWPNSYAPDGNMRISNGNFSMYKREQPKIFTYERRRKVFESPSTKPNSPTDWEESEQDYNYQEHLIGGVWQSSIASVESGPYRTNLKMGNDFIRSDSNDQNNYANAPSGAPSFFAGAWGNWSYGQGVEGANSDPDGLHVQNLPDHQWGISLSFSEQQGKDTDSSTSGAGSGEWQLTKDIRYKFWCTYLYDDLLQESHPTLFTMFPTFTSVGWQPEQSPYNTEDNNTYGWTHGESAGTNYKWGTWGTRLGYGTPDMFFQKIKHTSFVTGNGYGMFSPANGGGHVDHNYIGEGQIVYFNPMVNAGFPNGYQIGGISDGLMYLTEHGGYGHASDSIGSRRNFKNGDLRIRGARIYWSSNEDNDSNLYLMFDMHWEKGTRAYGMGQNKEGEGARVPWKRTNAGGGDHYGNMYAAQPDWGDIPDSGFHKPPKIITYKDLNGYNHDESITARWKTSTVIGNRVYIGNYERPHKTYYQTGSVYEADSIGWSNSPYMYENQPGGSQYNRQKGGTFFFPDSEGLDAYGKPMVDEIVDTVDYHGLRGSRRFFPDSICKSALGISGPGPKWDVFPENADHEMQLNTNDGDEIAHLDSVGDKLLVFKAKTLFVINVAGDGWSIESENRGLGLDGYSSAQCCKTDMGIAWINTTGIYHYDGSEIISLSSGKIDGIIKNRRTAFPFKVGGEGDDNIKTWIDARKWTFPEDKMEPNYRASFEGAPNSDEEFKNGNLVKSIGFDPTSRKLICFKQCSISKQGDSNDHDLEDLGASYQDVLIYSFDTDSWYINPQGSPGRCTNFTNYKGRLLSYAHNTLDPYYVNYGGHQEDPQYNSEGTNQASEHKGRFFTWTDEPREVQNCGPYFCHTPFSRGSQPTGDEIDAITKSFPAANYRNDYWAVTKDFTFGDPSVRKKIYKVYITYRCENGNPNMKLTYSTDGSCGGDLLFKTSFKGGNVDGNTNATGVFEGKTQSGTETGGGSWSTAIFTPKTASQANNIYSFQLFLSQNEHGAQQMPSYGPGTVSSKAIDKGLGNVDSTFEVNDITIVYRRKSIK